jgi:outer membrane cobalamin receptor
LIQKFGVQSVSSIKTISISLQEDSKVLNEVVIGYGSQKKKVTGAVSIVDSKTLEALKPVRIEQALTISGVNVTSQSGSPGAALDIRIRGYKWRC